LKKPPKTDSYHLKWEAYQRMKFLDAAFLVSGLASTNDLCNTFGIGRAQATKDFGIYKDYFGADITYNASLKRYVPTEDFVPVFLRESSQDFFDLFRVVRKDAQVPFVSLVPRSPSIEVLSPPDRLVNLKILSTISIAILQKKTIAFSYQSMSSHGKSEYELAPHVLVYNGFRWHVRGYSFKHSEFRDYVLGRFKGKIHITGESSVNTDSDKLWKKFTTIIITPHPSLTKPQKEIVMLDYGMKNKKLKIKTRVALVSYYLKLLHIGHEDEKNEPQKQQIILENKDEILPLVKF
jgi:hypothetical protein